MSEANKIEPALSAEEWEEQSAMRGYVRASAPSLRAAPLGARASVGHGVLVVSEFGDDESAGANDTVLVPSALLPAVMALANAARRDDDPGKITRADVADILAHADGALWRRDMTLAATLSTIAAKLGALLPPKEA